MSYIVILRKEVSGKPLECREFDLENEARQAFPNAEVWPSDVYEYVKKEFDLLEQKIETIPKPPWWKFWAK